MKRLINNNNFEMYICFQYNYLSSLSAVIKIHSGQNNFRLCINLLIPHIVFIRLKTVNKTIFKMHYIINFLCLYFLIQNDNFVYIRTKQLFLQKLNNIIL